MYRFLHLKKEGGFTLIELLITMLVAIILLTVAVPAYKGVVQNNRVIANANNLINALAITRSEAIRRRDTITICSSTDLQNCANSVNWESGWIILKDRDGDALVDDPPDKVLRVWESVPAGHTITTTPGTTDIQFDRLGATSSGAVFQVNNPHCKSGQSNRERTITLKSTGNLSVADSDCP